MRPFEFATHSTVRPFSCFPPFDLSRSPNNNAKICGEPSEKPDGGGQSCNTPHSACVNLRFPRTP